ncbi:MAG TPA: lipocalin family protein [Flavipsychrobacter sp.]|nr:lipocalin family protein [Flavipsychrobacter sp.]
MKKLLILCAGIALFSACKKDEKDNKSASEHLTAAKWMVESGSLRMQGPGVDTTENLFEGAEACDMDDVWSYTSDFKYTISEGATKCDPSNPDVSDQGVWTLINNNSKLVIVSTDGYADTADINVLNGSTFQISSKEVDDDYTYTYSIKFKH